MGLDATVCRNPNNPPHHFRESVFVDSASGLPELRDAADDRILGKAKLKARHERIGNIATVRFLREEIARAFGGRERLFSRNVVYGVATRVIGSRKTMFSSVRSTS